MDTYGMPELHSPNSEPPHGNKRRIGATWIIAIALIAIIILAGVSGMGWASSLSFFGLVGIIIYLCSLIVAAVQKKDKNPSGIGIAGSAVILIIGIVVGSHSGATKPAQTSPASVPNTSVQSQVQSKSESATSKSDTNSFRVGEVAKYNDIELTVTKVSKVKHGEYSAPKDGNEFVVVTVKYKNDGQSNVSYNPYDFRMKNSKGQITSSTFASDISKKQLESGALAPGGEVEGEIVYEEPKDDKGLILQYTGNIFLSESEVNFQLQ